MLDEQTVIKVGQDAVWAMILVGAPAMLTALAVGLVISLVQALTQIQEMTLTFVPKILAMLVVLVLAMPFMLAELNDLTLTLFARIGGRDL